MRSIVVELGDRSYDITFGQGILDRLPEVLAALKPRGVAAVVTDTNVAPLYGDRVMKLLEGAGIAAVLCAFPAGEQQKRLSTIETLIGQFLEAGMDRSSLVVALGGGVVGDMAGFAAASFMRGIPFVQIPTTIVAQVDSSVGGKTGVNHPLGKNTIGAFHQPSAVFIDMGLLRTLAARELKAGLAEVIKHGVIADAELFAWLEEHSEAILNYDLEALEFPVRRSCEIKAGVVAQDEREGGLRAILNYGHTFGHGIEAVTGYGRYLHGEAVALGMHAAGVLGHELGLVDELFIHRQEACIAACGLPVRWPELPVDEVLEAMRHDKKARAGRLKFIVPERMGAVVQRDDVPEDAVRRACESLRQPRMRQEV